MPINLLTGRIIGAAMQVHSELGAGLLESVYDPCFKYELARRGLRFVSQVRLPIRYGDVLMETGLKIDLIVEDFVVVELKAVEIILPVHCAQVLTYLKLSKKAVGLLINFNVPHLRDGIRRFVNHLKE